MNKSAKSRRTFWCLLPSFTRYSLILLLSGVLLSESVGATPERRLQIAQQAKRAYSDSFAENIPGKVPASVNITSLRLQIAQSPTTKPQNTKPALSLEEAKIKPLKDKALQLLEFGYIYGINLTEYTKAVGYLEQALAILRESKEPNARSSQGETLLLLGAFYEQLGEKQKAIDAYKQAQSLYHAENKPKEEAQALSGIGGVYGKFGDPKKEQEYLDKALAIHKANNDLPKQADTLRSIALKYQNLGETEKALDYHQQALKIYRQTKDLFEQAQTLSIIALVYSSRGDRPSAEKYIHQALELQKTIQSQLGQNAKSQENQIIILRQIAISYYGLGDTQQRIFYLNQGRIIAHELGKTQDEADLISSIGEAYYQLGETQKALENLNQALKLQREIKDSQGEANTLKSIASIYKDSGEFQQALDILNQALEISKQKQNSLLEGGILSTMSYVYRDLGAYELSIEKSKEILAIDQKSNPMLVGSALNSIGVAYLSSCFHQEKPEDCRQALDYYNQALKYAREQRSVSSEANILGSTAKAYELLKDYQQAIKKAKEALQLSRKYNLKNDEKTALVYLSAAYERAGNYQKALDASKQSLLLSQQLGDLTSLATVYKSQGIIYTSMKQPQQAIEAYNQQLKLAKQIGDTSYQTFPLYKIAIIERDRGNFNQAKTHIETVIGIVENTRSKVNSQDLRSSYFATVQDYYKFYIDLLMQLHKKDPSKGYNAEALHISERSRARSLIELLTEARADIRKGADPQLLAEERRLQSLLEARQKQLLSLSDNKANENQAAALKTEIENLLGKYRELQAKIRTTSPKYANFKYPNPLTLPQIQQQLDKDTLLLQYSLGEERSYLWAVTPNSLDSYELPGREAIEKSAGTFKELLRKCQKPGLNCQELPAEQKAKDFQQTTQAATELSKLILTPVAGKLGKKRLVIVADGALQEIPFAALTDLTPQPSSLPGKSEYQSPSPLQRGVGGEVPYQPLLVNHEIVNLPSVTAIATHREDLNKRQRAPKTLAVLADPVFALDDERFTGKPPSLGPELKVEQSSVQQAARNLKRAGWGRLLGTRTEAEQILKLVSPSESLHAFDFDANYNWVTSKELKQYRFILFATHGFADPINPEKSGIILSQIDKQGKPNIRRILHLGDIFNLDLGADLVVLSACETGLGKDVQGEGLVGLTRGLMYAGTKTAVVSLWQVNDTATSELMPQFYTAMLQQKASPTTALREAQLKLWQQENWRNPYYWAAFTLQGEWR
jgi:CHAT domain-containing protein/Flp pilus assembly protein TadD